MENGQPICYRHHIENVTGPKWVQAGFPDWVSQTEPTDRSAESTGCAIVYIYWMRSLGFTIPEIVQTGGTTLWANYRKLTGKTTAYQDLRAALQGLSVTADNPFERVVFEGRAVLYDQSAGSADVFGFDATGNMNLDTTISGWRTSWYAIVPGHFIGNGRSQLLLYDRSAGNADVVGFDDTGNVNLDTINSGWRTTWTGPTYV